MLVSNIYLIQIYDKASVDSSLCVYYSILSLYYIPRYYVIIIVLRLPCFIILRYVLCYLCQTTALVATVIC